MKIIGLTGGIASGKNFVADIFAQSGAMIFDADKEVHEIFKSDQEAILKLSQHFPSSLVNGEINRKILGEIVLQDASKLKILEEIIHPKVRKKYLHFLENVKKNKVEIAVLNIPLLLESKAYECDQIIALIASIEVRKERFLNRERKIYPEESLENLEKKFMRIVANQMTNLEREKRANFVIDTSVSKEDVILQVENILQYL